MELEFVKWLASQSKPHRHVALGIGDDAAVLELPAGSQTVVTTDMVTDGVHFHLRDHSAELIGRKAVAVNLSDLAAMAAEPVATFVSLNIPRTAPTTLPRELLAGMQHLAAEYDCPIAGGDTNVTDGPLVISVVAIGSVAPGRAWLRSGAQPGDRLLVTGKLGGSLQGKHLDFTPRVREALSLAQLGVVHAAMDLSDGLALDLARMMEASGVGAIVDLHHVPISPAAVTMASSSGKTPLEHALSDGEDFELLLAVPPDATAKLIADQPLECGMTDVGEFVAEGGLQSRDAAGNVAPLAATGYEHH